jgi:hypothetical protein
MSVRKLRFFWQNYFDSATITASSEAADYPVENLQNRWATWDWRSVAAGSGGEWIQAAMTVPRAIQGLILENMNLTIGAIVILTGDGNNVFTINPTAAMVAERRIVVFLPAPTPAYTTWLLSIFDPTNPDGYLSASRLYLGPVFEPANRCQPTTKRARASGSEVGYSMGGQTTVVKRAKYWTYDLPITIVGKLDGDAFADMDEECGIDTPLWICLNSTDEIASTIYVSFAGHIAFPAIIDSVLWETSLVLRQEL